MSGAGESQVRIRETGVASGPREETAKTMASPRISMRSNQAPGRISAPVVSGATSPRIVSSWPARVTQKLRSSLA